MGKKRRSRAFKENNQIINFEDEREKRREKRKQLSDKKKSGQESEPSSVSSRRAAKRVKRRLLYVAVTALVIGIIAFSVYNVVTLRIERAEAEAAKIALEKEQAKLKKEYSLIDSDEYIEEKARENLHMVRPGEMIYVLPGESEATGAAIVPSTGAAVTSDGALQITGSAVEEDGGVLEKITGLIQDAGDNIKSLLRK